jgi:peptidyl-prolyl cis-trans isomerase SurA
VLNVVVRLQRSVPFLAATVVLLTGCGVAGTEFHPGVAAQVGDQTITTRHVADVTDGYCSAIESISEGQPTAQQLPLRYLSHEFTTTLVLEAAAQQLADDYDVESGTAYRSALAQIEPQIAELSDHEQDSVLAVEGAQAYYQDVLTQIGGIELETAGGSDATDEDKAAAGQQVLQDWVADHDVDINPKYSVDFGTAEQVDTDTSFALSRSATGGLAAQPDETYTESLPAHLVCGG